MGPNTNRKTDKIRLNLTKEHNSASVSTQLLNGTNCFLLQKVSLAFSPWLNTHRWQNHIKIQNTLITQLNLWSMLRGHASSPFNRQALCHDQMNCNVFGCLALDFSEDSIYSAIKDRFA